MELPWLKKFADSCRSQAEQNRMPHALLLVGPAGVGKRNAAAWMAMQFLEKGRYDSLPEHPLRIPEKADLHWVTLLESEEKGKKKRKTQIGVDQIRGLAADLALTSHAGTGKVVIIEPANAMNLNASNSLLKTLEEPSGNALLILVADSVARLPATIMSRCQRFNILPPSEQEGLDWLNRLRPSSDWARSLRAAGLAPLAAVEGIDLLDAREAISRDFAAVASRRASPLKVAAQWAKLDSDFVLEWLCRLVQASIHLAAGSGAGQINFNLDKSVLQRIDSRNLFCYLEKLNRLRNQPKGSFNVLVTLESLLIDWNNGLVGAEYGMVQH